MKSGPFAEHSNILWGISSVAAWEKVNSGLIKMYKVEVTGQIVSLSQRRFLDSLRTPFTSPPPPAISTCWRKVFLPVYF